MITQDKLFDAMNESIKDIKSNAAIHIKCGENKDRWIESAIEQIDAIVSVADYLFGAINHQLSDITDDIYDQLYSIVEDSDDYKF